MPQKTTSRRTVGALILMAVSGCLGSSSDTVNNSSSEMTNSSTNTSSENTQPQSEAPPENDTSNNSTPTAMSAADITPVEPLSASPGLSDGPNPLDSSDQPIAATVSEDGSELTVTGVTRLPNNCYELRITQVGVANEQLYISLEAVDTSAQNVACTQAVVLEMYSLTLSANDVDPTTTDAVVISEPIGGTATYELPRTTASVSES